MKKSMDNINLTGYIEGYYSKLLSWENRKLIIQSLQKNNMNTYFYAPKEDINHRLDWRKKYSQKWRANFRDFTKFCKKNNVNIIAGIAPGLDFNFKKTSFDENFKHVDFNLLCDKALQLIDDGATSIALLLDDIPNNFKKYFGKKASEGRSHGLLANALSEKLKQKIYFVPRIYADELVKDEPNYLRDLSIILDKNIKVFYCGKHVVSKNLINCSSIRKILNNEIIYWDNFYANDYCPRRFFIGPYIGRNNIKSVMINPTGLIKTDLLILDIVGNSFIKKSYKKKWLKILDNHGVPLVFNKIKKYFLKPDFRVNPLHQSIKINNSDFKTLEFLLWKWKGELSREWYPYLFGLKNDLQILTNTLTSDRLIKTQTLPLSDHLSKN